MFGGLRALAKFFLPRNQSEPTTTSRPQPQSQSIFMSDAKSNVAGVVSFADPPFNLPSLRRSPGNRSLLPRYDSSRHDTLRTINPSLATPTQPTAMDLQGSTELAVSSASTIPANPQTPLHTAHPGRLPSWFPLSSTISMISRTTHETYSADLSPLFTGQLQSAMLTPATTCVVTPSSMREAGKRLEIPRTTARSGSPTTSIPPSPIPMRDRLETGAAVIDRLGETGTDGENFWIKVKVSGNQPRLSSAGASLPPLASVRPRINTSPQIVDHSQRQTISRNPIFNTLIVNSPVSSSSGSVHSSDSRQALAFNSDRSFDPNDNDAAAVPDLDIVQPAVRSTSSEVHPEFRGNTIQNLSGKEGHSFHGSPPSTALQHSPSYRPPSVIPLPRFSEMGTPEPASQLLPSLVDITPYTTHDNYQPELGDRVPQFWNRATSTASVRDSRSLLEVESDENLDGRSTPLDAYALVQPPRHLPMPYDAAPRVNLVAATSLYRLDSLVGPNAEPFLSEGSARLPRTDCITDNPPDYPRYAVDSLNDLVAFGRSELNPSSPSFISADGEIWRYSCAETIEQRYLSAYITTSEEGHNPDTRPRSWSTLGLVGTDAARAAATYLVINKKDRYEAVLKVIDPKDLSDSQLKKLVTEIKALDYLRGCPETPFVMAFNCGSNSPPFWRSDWHYIHIETPYAAGGNLAQHLGVTDEVRLRPIIYDLMDGIFYLHRHSVVHGNITPENITISREGICMIANFEDAGLLKWRSGELLQRPKPASLTQYTAPECRPLVDSLNDFIEYDHAVDIWGLGVVIYELRNGLIPSDGTDVSLDNLSAQMASSGAPEPLTNLLFKELLVLDPYQRANAGGFWYSRYFKDGLSVRPAFPTINEAPLIPWSTPLLNWRNSPSLCEEARSQRWTACRLIEGSITAEGEHMTSDNLFLPCYDFDPDIIGNPVHQY